MGGPARDPSEDGDGENHLAGGRSQRSHFAGRGARRGSITRLIGDGVKHRRKSQVEEQLISLNAGTGDTSGYDNDNNNDQTDSTGGGTARNLHEGLRPITPTSAAVISRDAKERRASQTSVRSGLLATFADDSGSSSRSGRRASIGTSAAPSAKGGGKTSTTRARRTSLRGSQANKP